MITAMSDEHTVNKGACSNFEKGGKPGHF